MATRPPPTSVVSLPVGLAFPFMLSEFIEVVTDVGSRSATHLFMPCRHKAVLVRRTRSSGGTEGTDLKEILGLHSTLDAKTIVDDRQGHGLDVLELSVALKHADLFLEEVRGEEFLRLRELVSTREHERSV